MSILKTHCVHIVTMSILKTHCVRIVIALFVYFKHTKIAPNVNFMRTLSTLNTHIVCTFIMLC